jgi:predicted dehydrogenase
VLCEKPLATKAADAEAMIDAADAAGRLLAVGMVRRYLPATQAIRELLARDALGELHEVHCFEGGPFEWPVRSESYFERSESGGGVFLDIGSHVHDLLTWWLGTPETVEYADDAMGGVEANCRLRLSHAGFEVDVRLSRDWARPNEYRLSGSRGWLQWTANEADRFRMGSSGAEYASEIRLHEALVEGDLTTAGPPAANYHRSFVEQIRSVVRAVRGEDAPVVRGAEALESVRLIERCYAERSLLPMPWLGELESRAALALGGSAA